MIISHIEACVLVLAEIFHQLLAVQSCLILIRLAILAIADLRHAGCRGIKAQHLSELIIVLEEHINFIWQILDAVRAGSVGRHDVDVEIPLRLRGAPLAGEAHKQIAFPENVVRLPV